MLFAAHYVESWPQSPTTCTFLLQKTMRSQQRLLLMHVIVLFKSKHDDDENETWDTGKSPLRMKRYQTVPVTQVHLSQL